MLAEKPGKPRVLTAWLPYPEPRERGERGLCFGDDRGLERRGLVRGDDRLGDCRGDERPGERRGEERACERGEERLGDERPGEDLLPGLTAPEYPEEPGVLV